MVYVTTSIVTASISECVSEDVVKGAVSMQLIKPIDYRMSLVVRALGLMVHRFLFPGILIWIGLELYKYFVMGLPVTSPINVLLFLYLVFRQIPHLQGWTMDPSQQCSGTLPTGYSAEGFGATKAQATEDARITFLKNCY